jgi:hypothetical protein
MTQSPYGITPEEKQNFIKSQKNRNIAIGLALLGFIVVIYFITMFKLGSQLFA